MQLICGMHRSGTSLVARLVHSAGADFGDPGDFHPADQWNRDGYFEQKDVLALNIALVNGWWWKFSYFKLPGEETIRRRAARRAKTIRALAAKYQRRVVKENRFCLTLDAWIRHGAEISEVLIVVREPSEVAASLKRRNRIPRALAYRLWCQHYERLLDASARLERRFLSYERLLSVPEGATELAGALAFFGLPTNRAAELIERTVRPRPQTPPPPAYPERVAALYRELKASAETSA